MMRCFLATILLIIFPFAFIGCTDQREAFSTNMSQKDIGEYLYLTEETDKNLISVQVPLVGIANQQTVNTFIKEQVYNELRRWLLPEEYNLKESATPIENISERMDPSEYSAQYLHISSRLSFESEEFISIVFTGKYNLKSAAHPNDVFFSINVDVRSVERVGVADVCTVDDTLYNAFLQYANSDRITRDELMSLNVFKKDTFIEGLTQEPKKGFYSYFTPTHIGISYPVVYALGDHVEAEIPKTGDGSLDTVPWT